MKTKWIRTPSGMRKVRVLRNGQYRFMKGTKKVSRRRKRRKTVARGMRKPKRTCRRTTKAKPYKRKRKRYIIGRWAGI